MTYLEIKGDSTGVPLMKKMLITSVMTPLPQLIDAGITFTAVINVLSPG